MNCLSRIERDLELLQKTVEHLNTKLINLHYKVDNIKVKVESVIVGVLKEVFGIGEMASPILQVVGEEGKEHLKLERNMAIGRPEDSTQEDYPLEKMEGTG